MSLVTIRPQATLDVIDLAEYIAQRNVPAGRRFLDAFEQTTQLLCVVPTIGSLCRARSRRMKGVRAVTIRGFRNFLVLYRATRDKVDVLRVVYGGRDLGPIIDEAR